MVSKIRGTVDLVGHSVLPASEIDPNLYHEISNIILFAKTEDGKWVEVLSRRIGHWRSVFRSTYMQWAIAINGLHLGTEKYASTEWKGQKGGFTVGGLTSDKSGNVSKCNLAIWDGDKASKAHLDTAVKMCVWGFIEMYSVLEEFVFEFYTEYLKIKPELLLKGKEFKELRKLYFSLESTPENKSLWDEKFEDRLSKWRRKKLYGGLHEVFNGFIASTGLKTPTQYSQTTTETWAESIRGISLVRNHLVHGNSQVSEELANFCKLPHSLGFKFTIGKPLELNLLHLQVVELFVHQLLDALNLSLAEHPDAMK